MVSILSISYPQRNCFTSYTDIFQAGVVATSISAVIAILCTLLILLHLRGPLSSTALRVQGASLGFCAVWLFSVLVPLTQFYRTRSAIVDASIGGVSLPDEAVQTVERALGLTSRYKDLFFCKYYNSARKCIVS
jgi:hypothetical protein